MNESAQYDEGDGLTAGSVFGEAEEPVETAAEKDETAFDFDGDGDSDGALDGDVPEPAVPVGIEEFREALRRAPGDWYVVHSYAGYENRVKQNLETRIQSLNMEDYIFQIEVPMEEAVEVKNGQRKKVKRNKFPGYVLVRMDLTRTPGARCATPPA